MASANAAQREHLRQFAFHLGLAFQIRDDILDIEGSQELLGKPIGSDMINHKSTYPALLTLQGAKDKLSEQIQLAHLSLAATNLPTSSIR